MNQDATIRIANLMDTIKVVDLGRKFLKAGPYNGLLTDSPEHFTKFAMSIILSPTARVLVAVDEKDTPIGVLAFFVVPHWMSGDMIASEIIWYVEPDYRGKVALDLYWAAKIMAKEMGAAFIQFTAPTEAVGKIYIRDGFKQIEVGYQKRL